MFHNAAYAERNPKYCSGAVSDYIVINNIVTFDELDSRTSNIDDVVNENENEIDEKKFDILSQILKVTVLMIVI